MRPLALVALSFPAPRPAAAALVARGGAACWLAVGGAGAGGLIAGFGGEVMAGDAGLIAGALAAGEDFCAAGPFCASCPGFAAAAALVALSLHLSRSFTRSCPD